MLALPLRGLTPELYHGKYVAGMFGSGEQGVWYDPSDLSTMFQDAAGTVPVTAVGQLVGKILDKSGRGNHATQATTTSRPTLSAQVNIINSTEDITSSWNSIRITSSKNLQDPLGGYTACAIYETSETGNHWLEATTKLTVPYASTTIKRVVYLKYAGVRYVMVGANQNLADLNICVDLLNGLVVASGSYVTSSSITKFAGGWWRVELLINTQSVTLQIPLGINLRQTIGSMGESYTGDPSKGLLIWRPDARVANESASLPAYQRVNTSTDYDTVGFPYYLSFDGVDDYLSTESIDFTATDKTTVFAGVRKLTVSASSSAQMILELSTGFNFGSFAVTSDDNWAARFMFYTKGTLPAFPAYVMSTNYPIAITKIVTGIGDISSDLVALRLDATQVGTRIIDQGSGNYGNYPLYIGRRGGTTYPFNGRLYGLIVRGAQTDDAHLTHAEKFLAYKSGVTL